MVERLAAPERMGLLLGPSKASVHVDIHHFRRVGVDGEVHVPYA